MDLRTFSPTSISLSDPRIGASLPMAAHRTSHLALASHPLSLPVTTARPSASSASSPSAGPSVPSPADRFLRSPAAGLAPIFRSSRSLPRASARGLCIHPLSSPLLTPRGRGGGRSGERVGAVRVRAGRSETEEAQGGAGAMRTQSVRDLQRPYRPSGPSERVNTFVRFLYGTATYAGLATAAVAGAQLAGLDWSGGFQLSLQGVLDGFAFSAPAIALVLALFQTGCLPSMAPCTQLCAATLTAALAGTLHYAMALPRDAVIVVTQSYSLRELRSAMRAWHERQEHQKIYPPMFASLLSLYYGIEWVMTGNLVVPMLTHALLNLIILHMSLVRVGENRKPPVAPTHPPQPPQSPLPAQPTQPTQPANKTL
ncbi:unnamed protein product [Closterium sp. NIES-53]